MAQSTNSKLLASGSMGAEYLARISKDISSAFRPALPSAPASLVIMPVSPLRMHAFWNLNAKMGELAQEGSLILLITQLEVEHREITQRLQYDVPIGSTITGQRDIQLPYQAKNYIAELGYRDKNHRFISLVTSNEIRTSRQTESPSLRYQATRAGSATSHAGTQIAGSNQLYRHHTDTSPLNQHEIEEQISRELRLEGFSSVRVPVITSPQAGSEWRDNTPDSSSITR